MSVGIVLVAEGQAAGEGLREVLAATPEFRLAGEAFSARDAVPLCRSVQPEVIVVDGDLTGASAGELAVEILRACPRARILVLLAREDEDSVVAAIRAGVRALVRRNATEQEIVAALRTVAEGGTYLSASASGHLLARVRRHAESAGKVPNLQGLSRRERQVLRLVAEGKRTKEVAAELRLEHNTVRTYRKTMMQKLGVSNLAEVIQVAQAAGLVPGPFGRGIRP